ncbi:MAG TPA: YigZ family protein [Caproicibacter sp.]|nr:YigZ family protein [Caproicibacter sp.]
MEEYQTTENEANAEFTERRSRFIGYAKPVKSEEEAMEFIRSIRALHREATHNVYAYVLRAGQARRYSDDGEPQGTAGVPVLDVLLKSGVTDTAVVVTRYFGGILLGAGGLVRAYSHGASIALEAAGIITMGACYQAKLKCDYSRYGKVAPLISEHGGTVDDAAFTDEVSVAFHIPCDSMQKFQTALADSTCGDCAAEIGTKNYYKIL